MKFGASITGLVQHPRDQPLQPRMDEVIGFVRHARDAGFDYVITGQHYLVDPFQEVQPVPLLARLIPESGDMGLMATLVAPLLNPVDLAETWASLDVLSNGRMGLSLGLGYRDDEYRAFGIEPRRRVRAFRDVVETLVALWTQESVTISSEHFTLDEAICTIRPLQSPHLPIWIAASADAAVERAARWGLPWNISPHPTFASIARQTALYRSVAEEHGHRVVEFPLQREVLCAATREEAVSLAERYLGRKYEAYHRWGASATTADGGSLGGDFSELAVDRFIIGTPDDCAEQIARYAELGVTHLHMRMNWAGMPVEPSIASLEMLGDAVMPHFDGPGRG